jgi:hypothetical protein
MGFFNGIEDFGMAVKMSKMTSAVDDQQPFERLA